MEAELLRAGIGRAEALAHDSRPESPRRAEFGDLFEKIVVRVEEEREALAETVDVEPRGDRCLHVRDAVRECEGDFLYGGGSRFANVIPADRDRVPVRQLALAEREGVGDDAQ